MDPMTKEMIAILEEFGLETPHIDIDELINDEYLIETMEIEPANLVERVMEFITGRFEVEGMTIVDSGKFKEKIIFYKSWEPVPDWVFKLMQVNYLTSINGLSVGVKEEHQIKSTVAHFMKTEGSFFLDALDEKTRKKFQMKFLFSTEQALELVMDDILDTTRSLANHLSVQKEFQEVGKKIEQIVLKEYERRKRGY